MTVQSALRALRQAGPWSVHSRLDGALLVKPVGRRRLAEKHGVLTRMYLASCLHRVLDRPVTRRGSGKEKKP